jgi:hypothetical protein
MPFGRYHLYVNYEKCGDLATIADCWHILDDAYSNLPDTYSDVLHWEIHDPFHGARFCKFDMDGGIWEACCEDSKTFALYLEMCGWDKMSAG